MIIILLFVIFIMFLFTSPKENFSLLNSPSPVCNNCYNKTLSNCLKCENCVISNYRCVPGDENGPLFEYHSSKESIWKDHKKDEINNHPQIIYSKHIDLPNYIDTMQLSRLGR